MLKVKAIRDDGSARRLFEIHFDGAPATVEALSAVGRVASRLIEENELPGAFRVDSAGVLSLDLDAPQRSFFHDGIVFAAIDAVNDPIKSPTLTRMDFEPPEDGSS